MHSSAVFFTQENAFTTLMHNIVEFKQAMIKGYASNRSKPNYLKLLDFEQTLFTKEK